MLELRPNCEWCDRDLPPDTGDARICTFECTWCADCIDGPDSPLGGVCPNCGGNVVVRPVRPSPLLHKFPAAGDRVVNPNGPAARRAND